MSDWNSLQECINKLLPDSDDQMASSGIREDSKANGLWPYSTISHGSSGATANQRSSPDLQRNKERPGKPLAFKVKQEGSIMEVGLKALEVTGTIDEHRHLHLDTPLPVAGPTRVRVIILIPDQTDIDEREWLRAAATNPAFDFLKEPEEDIYTLADGKPFHDQG